MFTQRQDGRMHNPSNVTKNAIVTYDVKNETVSNSLDEKPTGVSHPSFSYVTDQLTSMSDIPPQFTKTNLSRPSIASTQSCPVQQQMQHHHQQLIRNRSGNSNVFASDLESSRFHDTSSSSASNLRSVGELPPPPPSPPLSQRTGVSDRSRGSSSAMHSTGERSSRGQRSRRRPQGGSTNMGTGATAQYASTKFTNVDTDTGIDSPHQTPSPHRPVGISSPTPPTPPIRGVSALPYGRGQPVMHFNDAQDPTLNLGYLAGPSEGDTDAENDAVGRLNVRQFANESCQRNSVAVSAVSMMNTYGSESDQEQTSSEPETSDDESLQMESVSQVGQNRALLDEDAEPPRPNPQPRHFKPSQQQQHNDRHYPNAYHTHPANIDEGQPLINNIRQDAPSTTKPRPNRRPGNKSRRQRASNKDLSRVNSASSSTSSSYQHNTGDSGMSAGVGCSTEHSSLNSNASGGSALAGAVSRSRTAGNLSSYDVAGPNDHVTSEEELLRHQDGNFSSPTSPTASCVSEQSGYHSTGSSCWQYHEPHTVAQQMPRRHPRQEPEPVINQQQQQHPNTHSLGDRNASYPKAQQRYYPNTMNGTSPMMQDCSSAPTGGIDSMTGGGAQLQVARTVLVGGIGGKMARGRPQELSDVPEVSTSDFCEDYSDQSQ
uniref:Roundabout homolog 2-like n=1 Tax=Phallusia mammillata TaxID=59560 RepID=A0A6F9DRY7_9ASCI|nr:roundabout homolog 2-like [Phallusia mammillata]